jgi:hypothetical protein
MVTWAALTAAPEGSSTIPDMEVLVVCPVISTALKRKAAAARFATEKVNSPSKVVA